MARGAFPSRKPSRTAFSTPMTRSSLAWSIRNWMASAPARAAASLIASSRGIVLLELAGRAHAVIADADREGRSFLADLKCAVAALDQIRNVA